VVVVVAVPITAAAAAGACGDGRCLSPKPLLVPQPIAPPPVLLPVPQLVPVPVSTEAIRAYARARARADTILPYINGVTLSRQTLTYSSSSSAEDQAVYWLVEVYLGPTVDEEQLFRQRYVLGTLWFL
jgi:hypothetical protein